MSSFRTSKIEEKIAYEIFRSCRLCGGGAGYKMPIVQNVDLDGDVPLTQKIRDCVQIEVHQEDKMPPLICELCVDKVNDFYEFSEMCKQTNMKTRLRLGLPPQTMPRGAPNAGDCILGVTETIFVNEDSNEPIIKHKETKQSKSKKETSDKVKIKSSENSRNTKSSRLSPEPNRRATRRSFSSPTNILTLRNRNSKDQKNVDQPKKKSSEPLKSILKKEKNKEEDILVTPKSKRGRERESIGDLPVKRVKIEDTASTSKSKRKSRSPPRSRTKSPPRTRTRSPPRSSTRSPRLRTKSPETNICRECKQSFPSKGRLENHIKTHQNEIKNSKNKKSPPVAETRSRDRTEKVQVRGKNEQKYRNICDCGREYITLSNLHRHKINCTAKKDMIIDPKLMDKIRPLQIRISRCDPILDKKYSITEIPHVFGLDKNCIYPYFNIKAEPKTGKDGMVRIESPIKYVFDDADYIHWDSDTSIDSHYEPIPKRTKISSLSKLSLKTIFSSRYLGRVRRKRRKVKREIAEKLTDNFDVIDSFDDVHDLERINDSSFDQLFDDYQNISVPDAENIKDVGNEGNNKEDKSKEENSDKVSKEETSNIDVSKEDSDKDISKEDNSEKELNKEKNTIKDTNKEEDIDKAVRKESSDKDNSKEENCNKEVSEEEISNEEISINKDDNDKDKLSKEVINSEDGLEKEGNGNDKEDSHLKEETDKDVSTSNSNKDAMLHKEENINNNENDSLKENINQKEDCLNEEVNVNKDSRLVKEEINSNECESIQEMNKKDIDESNVKQNETNGLSEDIKGNKDKEVRTEQKDIQDIIDGNSIINKELEINKDDLLNSANNELKDNKQNANVSEEKTRKENKPILKTDKQIDLKNDDKHKDNSNNDNSNEMDLISENKKSINHTKEQSKDAITEEINKQENYEFNKEINSNKEETRTKERESKDFLRNEELLSENDLLEDTNDTASQDSIEFDERELDSDESVDKNMKVNSGDADKEGITKENTSTEIVNGENNEIVMDDQKLMDELNAQIGEDVMERHLSLDDFSEDEAF